MISDNHIKLFFGEGKGGKLGMRDYTPRAYDAAAKRLTLETNVQRLILEGQSDGSIAITVNATAAAMLVLAVLQGLRVLGKVGRVSASDPEAIKASMLRILE